MSTSAEPRTVITQVGDSVDLICWREYDAALAKAAGGYVIAIDGVFAANPHLRGLGPILPAGTTLTLPDLPEPEPTTQRVLW